jgi:hypothetical protein
LKGEKKDEVTPSSKTFAAGLYFSLNFFFLFKKNTSLSSRPVLDHPPKKKICARVACLSDFKIENKNGKNFRLFFGG